MIQANGIEHDTANATPRARAVVQDERYKGRERVMPDGALLALLRIAGGTHIIEKRLVGGVDRNRIGRDRCWSRVPLAL
jgi:hypothetical protein